MKIIIWQDKGKVPPWRKYRPGGYKAGELVEHLGTEYVCVNSHGNAVFSPSDVMTGLTLWFPVMRRCDGFMNSSRRD